MVFGALVIADRVSQLRLHHVDLVVYPHADAVQIHLLVERWYLIAHELAVFLSEDGLAHQIAMLSLADLSLVQELPVSLVEFALDLGVRLAERLVSRWSDPGSDRVVYLVTRDGYSVRRRGLRDYFVLDDKLQRLENVIACPQALLRGGQLHRSLPES